MFRKTVIKYFQTKHGLRIPRLYLGIFEDASEYLKKNLSEIIADCATWLQVNFVIEIPLELKIVSQYDICIFESFHLRLERDDKKFIFGVCPSVSAKRGESFYLTSGSALMKFMQNKINENIKRWN
ncbi:MAG: hypothetical protein NZO16_04680 [Deltaproteobacteria bacterium]|nr:hypothetical protein [Deltaproteobacteria bacterium]